jgi:hypothetical protein
MIRSRGWHGAHEQRYGCGVALAIAIVAGAAAWAVLLAFGVWLFRLL